MARKTATQPGSKKPRVGMRLRAYEVVDRAVERGVEWGWTQAHKFEKKPDEALLKDQIQAHVMLELHEIIDFEDEGET